jgi:hypothetical protein
VLCILGLFVPVNGPFRVCLNGSGSCPPVGLGVGQSTTQCNGPGRNNYVSCRAWAVFFFVLRARPLGPDQMYTYMWRALSRFGCVSAYTYHVPCNVWGLGGRL